MTLSDEHTCTTFHLCEANEHYETIKAENLFQALQKAKANFDRSLYADNERRTKYIPIEVHCADDNCYESEYFIAKIDPIEPKCTKSKHKYEDYSLQGNGGGIISHDKCKHCGLVYKRNTWDQSYGPEPMESEYYYYDVEYDNDDDE